MPRSNRQRRRGFTLIEVLVATLIMALAVTALLSNLSTSTRNLLRGTEMDRLTVLSKSKMDELITLPGPFAGVQEGVLDVDASGQPRGRWRAVFSLETLAQNGARLERIQLETWLENGGRRRTLFLETYRQVAGLQGGA